MKLPRLHMHFFSLKEDAPTVQGHSYVAYLGNTTVYTHLCKLLMIDFNAYFSNHVVVEALIVLSSSGAILNKTYTFSKSIEINGLRKK